MVDLVEEEGKLLDFVDDNDRRISLNFANTVGEKRRIFRQGKVLRRTEEINDRIGSKLVPQ